MQARTMTAGKTILLVDDDPNLRQSLAELLRLHEEVDTLDAESGSAALAMARTSDCDAILLAVRLPDMDGRDVCRLLRRQGVRIPILMLTAVDSDADAILGLNAGANDYITKPFRLDVLCARLRAQLRQHERSEYVVLTIGPYSFHPRAKLLIDAESGREQRLTEMEIAILRYLLHTQGKAVPRETLLSQVWGYSTGVTTHTVETHVYRLRQKMENDPTKPKILLTEREGYRLSC